jgi:hypothetical protein
MAVIQGPKAGGWRLEAERGGRLGASDARFLPTAPAALSDTWLTLLAGHMLYSLFVEPLEQGPHKPALACR